MDPLLKKHGIRFMHDVRAGDFVAAEASMEKIERRAIAVLRKLGKKKVNYS